MDWAKTNFEYNHIVVLYMLPSWMNSLSKFRTQCTNHTKRLTNVCDCYDVIIKKHTMLSS